MTTTAPPPVAPAAREASRWARIAAPVCTIGGLGLATVALHFRDPHDSGSWGQCPSAAMGIWCPGCGGLRAVNDLTHGDIGAAASSNLLFILALPVVVFVLARWLLDTWSGRERDHDTRAILTVTAVYGVALVAFTVLRNLPAGSWLAP